MPRSTLFIRLCAITLTSMVFLWPPKKAFSGDLLSGNRQRLETNHTVIFYHSISHLHQFDRMVTYSPGQWTFPNPFKKSDSTETLQSIGRKVDRLYERVQEILDMRKWLKKVSINLYADKEELDAAYFELYRQPCRIRAWYSYELNTIYVNVDDLHEELLAHEMAHAIIDHYLLVRPPPATAEILARYVHTHLYD